MGKKKNEEVAPHPEEQTAGSGPRKKILRKKPVEEVKKAEPPVPVKKPVVAAPVPRKRPKRERKKALLAEVTAEVKRTLTEQNRPVQKKADTAEYRNIPKPFLEKGEGTSIVFSSEHLKISQLSKTREEELRNWVYRESIEYDIDGIGLWVKEYSIKIIVKNRFGSDPINFSFIGETAYRIAKMFKINVKGLTITIKGD
jgi:hypothetical protein